MLIHTHSIYLAALLKSKNNTFVVVFFLEEIALTKPNSCM